MYIFVIFMNFVKLNIKKYIMRLQFFLHFYKEDFFFGIVIEFKF